MAPEPECYLVAGLRGERGELELVGPTTLVLRMQVPKGIGDSDWRHDDLRPFLRHWQGARPWGINEAVDDNISNVHTVLAVLLGQNLRDAPAHDSWVVEALPCEALAPAQGRRIVTDEEAAARPLSPHRWQHFFGHKERPPTGDVLSCLKHFERNVFQQLLVRRKVPDFGVRSTEII